MALNFSRPTSVGLAAGAFALVVFGYPAARALFNRVSPTAEAIACEAAKLSYKKMCSPGTELTAGCVAAYDQREAACIKPLFSRTPANN